jgi:hypothetical protein
MVRTSTQADMSTCNLLNSTFCPYTHWHKTVLCVAYAHMIYLSFSSGSHSEQSIITANVGMFGNNMRKPVLPPTQLLNCPTPRLLYWTCYHHRFGMAQIVGIDPLCPSNLVRRHERQNMTWWSAVLQSHSWPKSPRLGYFGFWRCVAACWRMRLETMTKNQAGRMPSTRFFLLLVAPFPDVCRAWRVCAYVSTCIFWHESETEKDRMIFNTLLARAHGVFATLASSVLESLIHCLQELMACSRIRFRSENCFFQSSLSLFF